MSFVLKYLQELSKQYLVLMKMLWVCKYFILQPRSMVGKYFILICGW